MKTIDDAVDQEEESRAPFFARAIRFIPAQLKGSGNGHKDEPVDPDAYNGDMPAERGESRPQPENDSTNLYEKLIDGLPLNGERPPFLVVDQEGKAYLGMEAAAGVAGLSETYLHALVYEGRLEAIKLNGRTKVVHLDSFLDFLKNGRRKPGRPRKNTP